MPLLLTDKALLETALSRGCHNYLYSGQALRPRAIPMAVGVYMTVTIAVFINYVPPPELIPYFCSEHINITKIYN